MMRLVFKALVVVVVAIGIGNYVVYLNTGRFPMNEWRNNFTLDSMRFSPSNMLENTKRATADAVADHFPGDASSSTTKIYKWTDQQGVVHYGERPVDGHAQALTVDDGKVTIMPSPKAPAERREQTQSETTEAQTPIEKARAAAEAMQKHHEAQAGY